ncbi:hypothetical protein AWRIB419_1308 [Oenococcus oeni AWRIB419]|nr:hypothetical protein AWRIB419_1308 [Oenococcus oeni AWRIB419]
MATIKEVSVGNKKPNKVGPTKGIAGPDIVSDLKADKEVLFSQNKFANRENNQIPSDHANKNPDRNWNIFKNYFPSGS